MCYQILGEPANSLLPKSLSSGSPDLWIQQVSEIMSQSYHRCKGDTFPLRIPFDVCVRVLMEREGVRVISSRSHNHELIISASSRFRLAISCITSNSSIYANFRIVMEYNFSFIHPSLLDSSSSQRQHRSFREPQELQAYRT